MNPRNLIGLLVLLVMFSPLAIDIYLPAMPLMQQDLQMSTAQVQSTLGLFLLSLGVGQIIIGPLTDRFGRRPVLLAGISVYAVAALLGTLSDHYWLLQLSRIGQGIGACSTSIVAFAAVRDCFNARESAKMYSYLNGALCIIPALAPALGGVLTIHFGWRACFAFMLLFAVLVGAVAWRFMPETRPQNTVHSGRLYHWARYQPILQSRTFLHYAAICMAGMTGILSYVTYASMVLVGQLQLSELQFSAWFSGNALINIVAFFLAPKVVLKLGERRAVLLGLTVFVSAGFVMLFSAQALPLSAPAYMLPMALLCTGFALMLGPASALALMPFAERAGTASALLGCIQMGGAALIAFIIQQIGLDARLAVALSVIVIALPIWLLSLKICRKCVTEIITE